MALGTYTDLQAAIAAWLDRTDLGAVIPDFITIFESSANTDAAFKSLFNRASTALNTVGSQNYVTPPDDFLQVDALINLGIGGVQDIICMQNYGTATALYTGYPNAVIDSGPPKGFIVLNGKLEIAPVPDTVYPLALYYYQQIPALADQESGSNWLLDNYPQIYLFGSILAAEAYLGDDPRLPLWGNLYDQAVQKLQAATVRDIYSGGPLQSRVDIAV